MWAKLDKWPDGTYEMSVKVLDVAKTDLFDYAPTLKTSLTSVFLLTKNMT